MHIEPRVHFYCLTVPFPELSLSQACSPRAWGYVAYLLAANMVICGGCFFGLPFILFFALLGIAFGQLFLLPIKVIQFITCTDLASSLAALILFLTSIPFNLFVDVKSAAAVLDVEIAKMLLAEDKHYILVPEAETSRRPSRKFPGILTRLWRNLDRYLLFSIAVRPFLAVFGLLAAMLILVITIALFPLLPYGLAVLGIFLLMCFIDFPMKCCDSIRNFFLRKSG
jgi:hypothetical protein